MRGKSIITQFLWHLLFLTVFCQSLFGKTIYVDDDGPADFDTIQAAIDDANDGDTVLVAPGTYTGEGNRDIGLKGKTITVKSEDGPETCIIDCQDSMGNTYVGFWFQDREDANSIVQGFTITKGRGITCYKSSPLITDCLITENTTTESGGGIRCTGSAPILIRCHISNNSAALRGGGLFTTLILYENTIPQPTLINCTITGNNSLSGGGIYCLSNSVELVNCTITGNQARQEAGGIFFSSGSNGKIYNSIVYENNAPIGKEVAIIYIPRQGGCPEYPILDINFSIVGSEPNDIAIIGCSDLVSGEWFQIDPLFVNPGYWNPNGTQDDPNDDFWVEGDYHLKSQAGRYDPNSGSWVIDDITSPCIDTGDPNSTIDDEPFPNGGIINMGAYGGSSQASKSYILAKTIYVDDDAIGLNDGTSWQNAYTYLQDALADADSAEKPVEIRVAQGTYKPNQGLLPIEPGGIGRGGVPYPPTYPVDEGIEATFQLINGVMLKGGFAGLIGSDPNERDVEIYETILSGDLNDDDIPEDLTFDNIDLFLQSYSDNSECVIKANSIDRTSVLDGFVITGGYFFQQAIVGRGGTSPTDSGGGMLNVSSSPTVINCTFERNRHAVYNHTGSNPVFTCCKFAYNFASSGGAIQNIDSNPKVSDCIFENNGAWTGGAICFRGECDTTLNDCIFLANQARQSGGAIYNDDGNITVTNCIFNNNRIAESVINGPGGAVFISGDSTTVFEECSFIQNETPTHGGGIYANNGILTLFKCRFYSNYAYSMGGGLFIGENVFSSIDNCTFESNIANLGSAVSTVLKIEEYLTLNRCVLAGNYSLNTGSAVCGGRRGGLELIQCTLDGNVDRHGTSVVDFDSYIIRNSVIWDQRVFHVDDRPNINISFSDVRNNWLDQSEGNIDVDPLFANSGYWADVNDSNIVVEPNDPNAVWVEGDYHLKSQAGRWDPNSQSWVIDDVTSPCIDAGDPNSPVGDEPLPNGGIINMGAYGGTIEASKSYIEE